MSEENKPKGKPQKGNQPPFMKFSIYWLYGIIGLVLLGLYFSGDEAPVKEVTWTEFRTLTKDNTFKEIIVLNRKNQVKAFPDSVFFNRVFPDAQSYNEKAVVVVQVPSAEYFSSEYAKWQNQSEAELSAEVSYNEDSDVLWSILASIGPFAIFIIIWIVLMRRMSGGGGAGGVFNVGKARAQIFDQTNRVNATFKDVAGLSEAKQEVEEIVSFLKDPQKYTSLGGKIPKGALLVGPPGTGKTLLAKAVAGEAGVPFFSISGSDFVEMFVGVGASRVRDLFRQAKEKSPCIIFIDEIDAIGRARGKNPNMSGNDERENTLNQLLTEMDGFGTNSGVIILAATNRADILDKALLRAGRFDRQISVDLPDLRDRKEIFLVHLRPLKLDNEIDPDFLARQTPGFSGADIANVCNEAALIAARRGKMQIQKDDFMSAVDRIIGGLEKRSRVYTQEEKRAIAIHESGHAAISWFLEHAHPLVKVTIVPRGKALGAAWYLPEERYITTSEQILDEVCATLGGRAAEEVFLGRISTGASNDLERVTKQVYAMICYYGMSDKLPNVNYYDSSGQDWGFNKPYSEDTAKIIDDEVQRIVSVQFERAKSILRERAAGHEQLSALLLEREVIYSEDMENIFGKRPWLSRSQEILNDEEAKKRQQGGDEIHDSIFS